MLLRTFVLFCVLLGAGCSQNGEPTLRDGYKLAEYVREHYPQIKIQLASGYSDNRHQQTHDQKLHESLPVKPFDRQHLLYRVRELLHRDKTDTDG